MSSQFVSENNDIKLFITIVYTQKIVLFASDRCEMCALVRRLVSNYVGQWIAFLIYRVTQKKTEPIYFCLKFINFILAV